MATDEKGNGEDKMRMLIHEIKNPLSTIYLTIDSLRNAKEDGEDPEFFLQMLEKSAKRIDEILNNIKVESSEDEAAE
jgi:nitrogen-specific signal transduction histidine kinase